ncbi:MAG: acetyl-CoA carboxylase biotin carboxyl carrier protein [Epulopiscium sp.]|nr:acetyl-CoA carboxylase biotin carboxyl carrier protein [Candidatus Epulonipiscium sp.]
MDYKSIEQLIKTMDGTNLTHLEIEKDGLKIKIKKEKEMVSISSIEPKIQTIKEINPIKEETLVEVTPKEEIKEGTIVKSPIVGTFYNSPSPEANPFVEVGSRVKKGDTLCIIEAMKLMNEIEADTDGEVVEVFVKNEELVEYNEPLFRIKS